MFKRYCLFYFHLIVWFFFRRQFDTPSFIDEIIKNDFSIWCLIVIRTFHLCWEYLIFLFLASMQWHCQDILLTNYKICIMTRYLFTKSNSCQLLLMGMSYSNYRHYFQMLTTLPKCKAWIESMAAMLGARWSQPISKIVLGLTSRRFVAWVICVVFKMITKTLCILAFTMKSFGVVNIYIPIIS